MCVLASLPQLPRPRPPQSALLRPLHALWLVILQLPSSMLAIIAAFCVEVAEVT